MSDGLERLCLDCGLCCDGTLFQCVAVSAPEIRALEGRGVGVGSRRGARVLAQPCAALEAKACTLYATRPAGCRDFTCLLGRRLVAGTVTQAEAQSVVAEAHQRVADVARAFPPPPGASALGFARRAIVDPAHRPTVAACLTLKHAEAFLRDRFLGG